MSLKINHSCELWDESQTMVHSWSICVYSWKYWLGFCGWEHWINFRLRQKISKFIMRREYWEFSRLWAVEPVSKQVQSNWTIRLLKFGSRRVWFRDMGADSVLMIEIRSIDHLVEGFGSSSVRMSKIGYNIWSSTTPTALSFQGNCGWPFTWGTDTDLDFFCSWMYSLSKTCSKQWLTNKWNHQLIQVGSCGRGSFSNHLQLW